MWEMLNFQETNSTDLSAGHARKARACGLVNVTYGFHLSIMKNF